MLTTASSFAARMLTVSTRSWPSKNSYQAFSQNSKPLELWRHLCRILLQSRANLWTARPYIQGNRTIREILRSLEGCRSWYSWSGGCEEKAGWALKDIICCIPLCRIRAIIAFTLKDKRVEIVGSYGSGSRSGWKVLFLTGNFFGSYHYILY